MINLDIARPLQILGLEPPAGYTAAEELMRAVNLAHLNPVAELEADIAAGSIAPADAAARVRDAAMGLAVAEKADQIARDLLPAIERLARHAIRDAAEDLITATRPAFNDAIAAIAHATEVLGPAPDALHVGTLGVEAAQRYDQWKAANAQLKAARHVRVTLARCGYGNREVTVLAYLADCRTQAQLDQAHQIFHRSGEGPANLAAHGIAVNLNTAAEEQAIRDQIAQHTRHTAEEARANADPRGARQAREWIAAQERLIPKAAKR